LEISIKTRKAKINNPKRTTFTQPAIRGQKPQEIYSLSGLGRRTLSTKSFFKGYKNFAHGHPMEGVWGSKWITLSFKGF
jgi:hypothetical protein